MSLLRKLSKRLDFDADTRKPYNTDGARPQSGYFEKEAKEIINNLTPAISPSSWVSQKCAYMQLFLTFLEACHSGRADEYEWSWTGRQKDAGMVHPLKCE
jgi:hypothetical protein